MKRLFFFLLACCYSHFLAAQQITLNGPAGSGQFGSTITVLTNGNYVIADPTYSEAGKGNCGAVYLYNGSTHALISTLKGNVAGDLVGSAGVFALPNGHFVVCSPFCNNGSAADAGAVTWCNGTTGLSGVVNLSNSLMGSTFLDFVGQFGVTVLPSGNYVVNSRDWNNGPVTDAGAVTWCNGNGGTAGPISSSNSLVGSSSGDQVGGSSITVLPNGNYVVRSSSWDNGPISGVGAVTWCNGLTGRAGVVSSSNSLTGSAESDLVGNGGIIVLANGNYLVLSPSCDNGAISSAGAVTWGSGTTGISGVVSSSNSLMGGTALDALGNFGVTLLSNGNYVTECPFCDINGITDAGAVTWGNGTTGTTGVVSSSNSLVGGTAADRVGDVTALTNGNYVVASIHWTNGSAAEAGAVTLCNGTTVTTGVVSTSNSLVGSTANDRVGFGGIKALPNGNYVVASPVWNNGAATDAGAVTWGSGTTGITGVISSSNSLVGGGFFDKVGSGGLTALNNGNYVVCSPNWDVTGETTFGAVTWGNGTTGITGVVSSSNSLVGSFGDSEVGSGGVTALSNGNYVVSSPQWDDAAITNAGAVTWCNGTTGTTGLVSSINSLVGNIANSQLGISGITALPNGNYIVIIPNWSNGGISNMGAITWCDGTTGIAGLVSSSNSLVGSTAGNRVGSGGINVLANGNFVVISSDWDNGPITNAGAVTWGNGATGITGVVSSGNSLVGGTAGDAVGSGGITVNHNGSYIVSSTSWDNGGNVNAGAVTLGNGSTFLSGTVNSCNSVTGSVTGSLNSSFNPAYGYLLVGVPASNRVVIYNPTGQDLASHLDVVSTSIAGSNEVPFVTSPSCRIIATLTPNGASPVSGTVQAQAWIESGVPTAAGQPFVARHYEITPASNPGSATARVTLYFTQQEFTDFNNDPGSLLDLPAGPADAAGKANLRIEKRSGTSNNGTGLPNSYSGSISTLDPADADIVWNEVLNRWEVSFDVNGFSGFFVKTVSAVLPLTLLDFNGRLQNDQALLNWKTENEVNTDRFLVERSLDGLNFTTVGTVNARNQPGTNLYSHVDAGVTRLGVSLLYYRLKQTDVDSRFSYSRIIALPVSKQSRLLLYPNPVHDQLMLSVSAERAEKVRVSIVDNAGRVLRQQPWNLVAGSTTLQWDLGSLPNGIYYLEVKGETTEHRKVFVKQ